MLVLRSVLILSAIAFVQTAVVGQSQWKSDAEGISDGKARSEYVSEGYGEAVAISGSFAFVAEPKGTLETGNVTVLARDSVTGAWTRVAQLQADPPELDNRFGLTLDAENGRLIVGAPGAKERFGAAYVYRLQPSGDWVLEGILAGSESSPNDEFVGKRLGATPRHLGVRRVRVDP